MGSNTSIVARFLRIQFTPIMIAPVTLGAALAWHLWGTFNPLYFVLALCGSVLLHLAANAIDDVYDYVNGVDGAADAIFPKDSPAWKPMARGMMSLRGGYQLSYALYGASLLIGVYLSIVVGWIALAIAAPGILLSYFYTAPPLKLDYRGLGLGELSILVSFGPIPALGAFYVLSSHLSWTAFMFSLPSGILTVCVLLVHDLIYIEPYQQSGKRSLAVMLGRRRTSAVVTCLGALCYAAVIGAVIFGFAPPYALGVLLAFPLFMKVADFSGKERPIQEYGARTKAAFLHSSLFTILLAAAFAFG